MVDRVAINSMALKWTFKMIMKMTEKRKAYTQEKKRKKMNNSSTIYTVTGTPVTLESSTAHLLMLTVNKFMV